MANPNIAWVSGISGVLNGQPVEDPASGLLFVPVWLGTLGTQTGTIRVYSLNYATGGNPTAARDVLTQDYGLYDAPNLPNVAFSPTGATVYVPYSASGSAAGKSGVIRVPHDRQRQRLHGPVAEPAPRRHGAVPDPVCERHAHRRPVGHAGVVSLRRRRLGAEPQRHAHVGERHAEDRGDPGGPQLGLLRAQRRPGLVPHRDHRVRPAENGELWRYSLDGSATTPQTGLTIAIDDSGASWLRLAGLQVQPLALTTYRDARGATH